MIRFKAINKLGENQMKDVTDKKGISDAKLEHIFLGTVKKNKVSGYHCDKNFGDEKLYAETRLYPKSKRIITANKHQKLFEAIVREKTSGTIKKENGGKSTFFNNSWSRQEVVDCIARLKTSGKLIKEYRMIKKINSCSVYKDSKTGIIVVNNVATTYPLLKY